MEVFEDDVDGFLIVRERVWYTGSWELCRKDDLAVLLDLELVLVVCVFGKYFCQEDKVIYVNCCFFFDLYFIYSVSFVK